jgi:hypothetical protein
MDGTKSRLDFPQVGTAVGIHLRITVVVAVVGVGYVVGTCVAGG